MLNQGDLAALFHSVLFAYQKTLSEIVEDMPGAIAEEALPRIENAIEKIAPKLTEVERTDEILIKYADELVTSGFVESARVQEDNGNYILEIHGCILAEHVHSALNPKDVTCPWAIIAMALAQKTTNRRVLMNSSAYTSDGAKTPIQFLHLPIMESV